MVRRARGRRPLPAAPRADRRPRSVSPRARLGGSCQGAGEVVVVGVTGDGVVLVACGLVGVVGLVLVVAVAVAVDVAGVVVVTVVGELVVVTVVVGLVFVSLCVEAPKNVVGWPLPVTECPAMRSGTVKSATTIANASRPVRTAALQWRRRRRPQLGGEGGGWAGCGVGGRLHASGRARRRRGRGAGAADVGSVRTCSGSCMASVGSRGVALVRGRTAGRGGTGGSRFAVVATVCTGRRSNSETSATTTGVTAALISVPVPQIREAPYAAAADAMLAMTSVCSETPLPRRLSLRFGSGSGDATTSA